MSHADFLRKALEKDVPNSSNTQTVDVTDEYGRAIFAATDDLCIHKTHKEESFLATQVTGVRSSSDIQNPVARLHGTDLSAYLANEKVNTGIAAVQYLSTDSKTRLLNHLDSMPETNTRLTATKARLEDGHLEVLFSAKTSQPGFDWTYIPVLNDYGKTKSPCIRVSGSRKCDSKPNIMIDYFYLYINIFNCAMQNPLKLYLAHWTLACCGRHFRSMIVIALAC